MSMALTLYDDTKHVNLQGRQYRLFNFDLGEGIVRDHLSLGLIIAASWAVVMWLAPSLEFLPVGLMVALWVGPPWVAIKAALSPDRGSRPRYALWWCRTRYLARRHRPMVPGPGHRPVRPWLTRLEPLLRPTRHPGASRPFTVHAEIEFLHLPGAVQ
ncbi:MAG TPA: hypothetical protein VIJ23_17615 [Mycobacterium sp.]